MKTLAAFVVGVLTGLAFVRIPHYVGQYADHSLPAERTGDKSRYYNGGVIVSDEWPPPPVPDPLAFERPWTTADWKKPRRY